MNSSLILFSSCVVFFVSLPHWGSIARFLIDHMLVNLVNTPNPPPPAHYDRPNPRLSGLLLGFTPRELPAVISAGGVATVRRDLEALVIELHRSARAERDAIRLLRQDIRTLGASDELLQQRVLSLERAADRRDRPQLDTALEQVVSEHVGVMRMRQEHSDGVLSGLAAELESEKQKRASAALPAQLHFLRRSQASLDERVDALEAQLAAAMASSGREDGRP
jgi:hypothetical protein